MVKARHSIADLLSIMEALRTPGTGCPWDLEQTYETIAPYTIEEAYEVADAIGRRDFGALKDELGDLLLQVVYHARMAEEDEYFNFDGVVAAICDKMIRRHPHVFGSDDEKQNFVREGFWERMKAQEKAGSQNDDHGVLDDVPLTLPALSRALKLQDKAAGVGFDWPSTEPVFDKIREEIGELEEATKLENPSRRKIAEELGDVLFVMANLARHMRIDPEDALRQANAKFVRRFGEIEKQLFEEGRSPRESDLEEMDRLWDKAKERESKQEPEG